MKRVDYNTKKRKEAITALQTLLNDIKKGVLVPYSIGIWQSGINNHVHVKFEAINTDFPSNSEEIQEDS